jgi:hypothetical protein
MRLVDLFPKQKNKFKRLSTGMFLKYNTSPVVFMLCNFDGYIYMCTVGCGGTYYKKVKVNDISNISEIEISNLLEGMFGSNCYNDVNRWEILTNEEVAEFLKNQKDVGV